MQISIKLLQSTIGFIYEDYEMPDEKWKSTLTRDEKILALRGICVVYEPYYAELTPSFVNLGSIYSEILATHQLLPISECMSWVAIHLNNKITQTDGPSHRLEVAQAALYLATPARLRGRLPTEVKRVGELLSVKDALRKQSLALLKEIELNEAEDYSKA